MADEKKRPDAISPPLTPILSPRKLSTHGLPIPRPAYTQHGFNEAYVQLPKQKSMASEMLKKVGRSQCLRRNWKKSVINFLPIIDWMRKYKVKEYLMPDIMTGFTVAMFQVPQSLGYTLLASVPPVYALYNAMFPMMIYLILGTVRQASVGADAIISMMTGGIVRELAQVTVASTAHGVHNDSLLVTTEPPFTDPEKLYDVRDVTSALCFLIGMYQLAFGMLNLGVLNVFLSEQMVNGFATGVAVQVAMSQTGALFGLHIEHFNGLFAIIKTVIAFFQNIGEIHWPTTLVSIIAVVIILVVKILIDPHVVKRFKVPLPTELVVVILFTLASHLMNFETSFGIDIVKDIPQELPDPTPPNLDPHLLSEIAVQAFFLAIVSFALTLSLGRIFGQKHGYEVSANQEFLALGASHIFSSFFSCFPIAASVPRSAVQEGAGGKTQVVSIVNIVIIVFMVLFLGHYLEELPICVLAAIIVTSLKKIVMQVQDFKRYWDLSRIDGQVWMVSFVATCVLDVITGLGVGVAFSLLTLIYKIQRPKSYLLGSVPNTEFYVPIKKYQMVNELPGIKIFHFGGPVHFANCEYFKTQLAKKAGFTVREIVKARKRAQKGSVSTLVKQESQSSILDLKSDSINESNGDISFKSSQVCITDMVMLPTHIIMDFSRVSFMDGCSVSTLQRLTKDYESVGVKLFIACCSTSVFDLLKKGGAVDVIGSHCFFPSVFDAVREVTHPRKRVTISTPDLSESTDDFTNKF